MYNPEPLTQEQDKELESFDYDCTDPRAVVYHIELNVYNMWLTKLDICSRAKVKIDSNLIECDREWIQTEYRRAIGGKNSIFDKYRLLPVVTAIGWWLYGADKFIPHQRHDAYIRVQETA